MFDVIPVTSEKPTDCGATCLKMLLAYYEIDVDLDTLIKECGTNIRGCSAKDLIDAGKKHGLDMKAWRELKDGSTPDDKPVLEVDILEQDRPAIVWWKYTHYCVYCGTDDAGNVVICNPDRGRYRMSEALFRSFYTNVCLTNGIPGKLPEEA